MVIVFGGTDNFFKFFPNQNRVRSQKICYLFSIPTPLTMTRLQKNKRQKRICFPTYTFLRSDGERKELFLKRKKNHSPLPIDYSRSGRERGGERENRLPGENLANFACRK